MKTGPNPSSSSPLDEFFIITSCHTVSTAGSWTSRARAPVGADDRAPGRVAILGGGTNRSHPLAACLLPADGGLKTVAVLLGASASATRHRLDSWSYLRDAMDHLAVRSAGAGLSDFLPDAPVQARSRLAA